MTHLNCKPRVMSCFHENQRWSVLARFHRSCNSTGGTYWHTDKNIRKLFQYLSVKKMRSNGDSLGSRSRSVKLELVLLDSVATVSNLKEKKAKRFHCFGTKSSKYELGAAP
jgi:hypothetical protein